MRYTHNDYSLIEAQDNVMNYIILRNRSGEILVADWDLSEGEVETLVEKFEADALTDADIMSENKIFTSEGLNGYNTFKVIA